MPVRNPPPRLAAKARRPVADASGGQRADHDKVLDLFRAYDGRRDDDGMTDLVESICQELVAPAEPEPPFPAVPDLPPRAPVGGPAPPAPRDTPRSAGLDASLLTGQSTQRIPH